MGLFNSIMKGMGFDGKESPQKDKKQEVENKTNDKYSNFDNGLANSFVVNEFKSNAEITSQIPNLSGGIGGSNLVIYAPKDNKDIKVLVECLRRREACIVNLGLLKATDAEKILQFLSLLPLLQIL